jgi:hypothetical protein
MRAHRVISFSGLLLFDADETMILSENRFPLFRIMVWTRMEHRTARLQVDFSQVEFWLRL